MRLSTKITIATALILCGSQGISYAAECSANSGAFTTPLLELYTSEGCSSCPPADKWLSTIKSNKVTPLAFHVDYWDYIGWKDKFSKAEYSDRQRKSAAFAGAGFVYTPQFVMNGRDFKGWDNSRLREKIEASQKQPSRANLSLRTFVLANGESALQASANAVNPSDIKNMDIFVAIYENDLISHVNAGENSGRVLKHDYVVRQFFGAYQLGNQNDFSKQFTLNLDYKNHQAGAVLFVQDTNNGEILQSLQLPFCS